MLTEEDVSIIQYFHQDKDDITRWAGWEECKQRIKGSHPELIQAIEQLTVAERTLNAIVKGLEETTAC